MTFPQFLEKKFLEWQSAQGGRRTVAEFAKYLGVKQSSVSMWWTGTNIPNYQSVSKLAEKLGMEVYDVLGLERPNEDLFYINRNFKALNAKAQKAIREQVQKYLEK